MKKNFFLFLVMLSFFSVLAQHNPQNWVIGGLATAPFKDLGLLGATVQLNYASNCYTTYVNELTVFNVLDETYYQGASSVNLIINNFKRQRLFLTGGVGLSLAKVDLDKEALDDAFFNFSQGDLHLTALFKVRTLLQLNSWSFWTTEINVNTLGDNFVTFSTGINYEIPQLKARHARRF